MPTLFLINSKLANVLGILFISVVWEIEGLFPTETWEVEVKWLGTCKGRSELHWLQTDIFPEISSPALTYLD